jgi:PKD repeat protein/pimeloyl-ACP methyl ester carboxylesterase
MNKILILGLLLIHFSSSKIFAAADLVVSTSTIQQSQIDKGDLLVIQATVKNQGNLTAGINFMFLYLSKDKNFTPDKLIGRVSIKQLPASQTQSITFVCSVPTYLVAGNYYVGFELDPFNSISEDNENNQFAGTQLVKITNNVRADYRLPYPIIFIHGLAGNSGTWNAFTNKADSLFGWIFGGKMDFCLNYDNDRSQCSGKEDYQPFINTGFLTKGDYYYVNFDVSINGESFVSRSDVYNKEYSNQSAIVKQGWAIKDAIRTVLDITKSQKVILVGHSMGGLAAREYIQNKPNWQDINNHNVAKLLTVATPNGGSNETGGTILALSNGIFEKSEAVRDLRWKFTPIYWGQYLEGGYESILSLFWNNDVNCDGDNNDNIIGLNTKTAPSNINYACILSPDDGIVAPERADLNKYLKPSPPNSAIYADKFSISGQSSLTDPFHLRIHKENPKTIMQGLDEPFEYNLAYEIPLNSLNYAFITEQAPNNPLTPPNNTTDYDDFKIKVTQSGTLKIDVFNIPVQSFTAFLVNSNYQVLQQQVSNGESNISFSKVVQPGEYYIEFGATPTPNSYAFPYAFQTVFTPTSGLTANFSANIQEGCLPLTVNFSNQSQGNPTTYSWSFIGGTPISSTSPNPSIVYNTSGIYPVSLTVKNTQDNHSTTRTGFINVTTLPNTDFTSTILQGDTVVFTNRTNMGGANANFSWSFGDGGTSTQISPTYKYRTRGIYNVKLTAQNVCGNTSKTKTVSTTPSSIGNEVNKSDITLYPNPTDGRLSLIVQNNIIGDLQIVINNTLGQTIWQGKYNKYDEVFKTEFDLRSIAKGTYILKIIYANKFEYHKFIVN